MAVPGRQALGARPAPAAPWRQLTVLAGRGGTGERRRAALEAAAGSATDPGATGTNGRHRWRPVAVSAERHHARRDRLAAVAEVSAAKAAAVAAQRSPAATCGGYRWHWR